MEKYRGVRSRFICPSCGFRDSFVLYVREDGTYVDQSVGRCNRESKCGYHYPPREFFRDNPNLKILRTKKRKTRNYRFVPLEKVGAEESPKITELVRSSIPYDLFKETLRGYEGNDFFYFLRILFPHSLELVESTVKRYLLGTYQDYTCFPYVDQLGRVCRAKLIRFDRRTGKRLKGRYDTHSLVAKLKSTGKMQGEFIYKQTFFGEHILSNSSKPAAIVESEKSAVIGSICMPEFNWLAVGSKQSLNLQKLRRLGNRKIILYPDADGYELWQKVEIEARRNEISVSVSSLIERQATSAQKREGCDLADYLINEQIDRLEAYQDHVEKYNAKLRKVLNDEKLLDDFETILEERKSILMENGGLSDVEAEREITKHDYVRQVVLTI